MTRNHRSTSFGRNPVKRYWFQRVGAASALTVLMDFALDPQR